MLWETFCFEIQSQFRSATHCFSHLSLFALSGRKCAGYNQSHVQCYFINVKLQAQVLENYFLLSPAKRIDESLFYKQPPYFKEVLKNRFDIDPL